MLCDNAYNILAISDGIDGNHHDSYEIIANTGQMIQSLQKQQIDYHGSHLNADAAFDVQAFRIFLHEQDMIANIKQNKRNSKKNDTLHRYMNEYIYQNRFKIEVVFAWLDTYKRIIARFEQLTLHFKAWLFIGSALINFRHLFN